MNQTDNRSIFSKVFDVWMDLLVIQTLINGAVYIGTALYKQYKGEDDGYDDYDYGYDRDDDDSWFSWR